MAAGLPLTGSRGLAGLHSWAGNEALRLCRRDLLTGRACGSAGGWATKNRNRSVSSGRVAVRRRWAKIAAAGGVEPHDCAVS